MGPGTRAYGATPRTLGQLFFLAYVGGNVGFQVTHSWVWVSLSSVAVAALSITTKFGNEPFVFIVTGMAVIGYWLPLATAVCGYLVAITPDERSRRQGAARPDQSLRVFLKHFQKPFLHADRQRFPQYFRRLLSKGRRGDTPIQFKSSGGTFTNLCVACFLVANFHIKSFSQSDD